MLNTPREVSSSWALMRLRKLVMCADSIQTLQSRWELGRSTLSPPISQECPGATIHTGASFMPTRAGRTRDTDSQVGMKTAINKTAPIMYFLGYTGRHSQANDGGSTPERELRPRIKLRPAPAQEDPG